MKTIIINLLLLVSTVLYSINNNKIDSLLNEIHNPKNINIAETYNKLAKEYRRVSFEDCLKYANLALSKAEVINNNKEKAKSYNNIGDAYFFQNNFNEALINYNEALDISKDNNIEQIIADTYSNIAGVYVYTGDLSYSEELYNKALKIYNKINDKEGEANGYNNIGTILLYQSKSDKAEEYFNKALEIKNKIGNKKDIAVALNNLGVLYQNLNKLDKSFEYFIKAQKKYKEINYLQGLAEVYQNIGLIYQSQGEHKKSIENLLLSIKIYKSLNNSNLPSVYNNLGSVYEDQANYKKAIEVFNKSLKISEKNNDKKSKGMSINNIANVYIKLDNLDKALIYYKEANKIFTDIEYAEGIAITYTGLGNIYSNLGMHDKAIEFYNKSVVLNERLNNFERLSDVYQNLGALYEFKNDTKKALYYYEKSLKLKENLGINDKIALTLQTIGSIYKNDNNYEKALEYYNKSFDIAQRMNQKEIIALYYKYLSEIYYLKNNYKIAIENLFKYNSINDSIKNNEITKQITEIMTKYETDKKEQEIEKLNIKNELNNTKIRQQYFIIFGFGGLIILVVLFLFLILRQFKQKKAANIKLQSQNKIILEQSKEITDSINYAKNLQTAILPSDDKIKSFLPNSFILYKPRDIVSGDFYWIHKKDNKIIFTAADCTGHGVPGAFMSIIGSLLLDYTIEDLNNFNAADILSNLKVKLVKTLNPEENKRKVQDGMDMAMIVFTQNEDSISVDYSGAYNPLYLIRNGILTEYKATKMPVGLYQIGIEKTFINNTIDVHKDDLLYIFSDGYADQFGGKKGKKFKSKNLKQLLVDIHKKDMNKQKEILNNNFEKWRDSNEQIDDVLLVGIKI